MTAQKRTFSSFADNDYLHFSTPTLPGFSSLSDVVYGEQDVPWGSDIDWYPQGDGLGSPSTLFASGSTDEVAKEQSLWLGGDELSQDPFVAYNSNSEPATQDSEGSARSQRETPGSLEPRNVCYGMVYLSKVKLIGAMQAVMQEFTSLKEGIVKSHHLLDVVCDGNELYLALPSGLKAAQLNQQISEALASSVAQGDVRLQALLHKETILNDIASATTQKNSETTININVYGRHERTQSIGQCLSKHKIWLQRPDWREIESVYENPHVIHFAAVHSSDTSIAIQSEDTTSSEPLSIHVENVYAKLSRADHLRGVAGDSRLTTQLLPHQEVALDFMMQREHGDIPDEFNLWQQRASGEEAHYWHKITGHKMKTKPDEHGGGILADEMGMGKTFSTIALVIATLEIADAWSHDREVHLSENIPAFKTLSRATLVVVPSPLLLSAWQKELRKHTEMALKVFVYHGTERNIDRTLLAKHDIVLTTYHTLVSDHARNRDLMTQIAWYRIVLDEAHFIRRSSTFLHKRVAELDAKFRWCLTGTPIQNSLDDVGALFSFLNISPFDRIGYFRKYISAKHTEGTHGKAMAQDNLVKLLDAMCLRRTKDQINLLPVNETIRFVKLSRQEREQYESMKEDMKRAMHNIIGESDSRQRFGSFQAKLQLRLLCNHGTYQNHFHWAKNVNLLIGYVEGFDRANSDENTTCSICGSSDSMLLLEEDLTYTSNCVHVLCTTCRNKSSGHCPCCDFVAKSRNATGPNMERDSWTRRDLQQSGHSSKMEALVQDLLACRQDKSIVFSCWTTTLELVALYLKRNNIPFERIDGQQTVSHRQKVLDAFSVDKSISVLIMTTGVGAFGLDLIAANRVFLIEPQWNPSVESQAVGRTTRIGQHKTVEVIRYIAHQTVEEELRNLQRRKRGMARMAEKDATDGLVKTEDW